MKMEAPSDGLLDIYISAQYGDHHFYFDRAKGEREVKKKNFSFPFFLFYYLAPSSKTELHRAS